VSGALSFEDILLKSKMTGRAMGFYWHHTPQVRISISGPALFLASSYRGARGGAGHCRNARDAGSVQSCCRIPQKIHAACQLYICQLEPASTGGA